MTPKWHLTKMASQNYIIGFLKQLINTLEPTPTVRHRKVKGISLWGGKNSTLKSHDQESESYNKFKNSLTQVSRWQITLGHFLARYAIFLRYHFLCLSYLSNSAGAFVMCHFGKVPLFPNSIKKCHFYLGVSVGCQTVIIYCFTGSSKRDY